MNPIEKAIRAALEKGDAEDRAYREKVYRTVHAAVERTIAARDDMPAEAIAERRAMLRQSVRAVESEFVAAVVPVEPEAAPAVAVATPPRGEAYPEPVAEARRVKKGGAEKGRRGALFAALFLGATVIAALGIGGWWIADRGLLRSAEERDTSVPNPPALLEDEEFDPEDRPPEPSRPGDAAARENWITVFSPEDISVITTTAGASAEVVATDTGPALRIRSEDAEAAVLFDVGQGILERIAGRPATFNIVASAGDGGETQISVTCNFAELGGCGRNRYNVAQDRGDFLFERDMPDASPGAAGTLAVTSDVEGEGRPVDIFEIRVSVER